MEADYLLAAIPEPVTILGHRLLPFSLGHAKILRRMGNAFATGKAPNLIDLLTAVFTCSRQYHEAVEGLEASAFSAYQEEWNKAIPSFDFLVECQKFAKYMREGSLWPELHDPEEGGRMPGAPFIQRVQLILQGHLNHSVSEALNKPWGEALHDYFAFWELEGQIKILSQDDVDSVTNARAQQIREEILKEFREKGGKNG
jgi:hypothetical protein